MLEINYSLESHIGSRLKKVRKEHKLSMDRVGELLELSGQQIGRFEKGMHKINASQLYVLSVAFEVPIAWFFLGYESSQIDVQHRRNILPKSKTGDAIGTSKEYKELLTNRLDKLSKKQMRAVIDLIDVMAE